jgi:hypothetical protein
MRKYWLWGRCDPNTWFEGDGLMTARRDIQPGEELTYDYCTSDTVLATRLSTCYCGSSLCRGMATSLALTPHRTTDLPLLPPDC